MSLPVDDRDPTQRAEGLWTQTVPFRLLGAQFGRRSVLLYRNGLRALFSPNLGSQSFVSATCGSNTEIDYLIAPTWFHDTHFAQAIADHPHAKALVSPSFPSMPKLSLHSLEDAFPEEWRDAVTPYPIGGMPKIQEIVFYDRESGTLLISDLIFNFDATYDAWSRGFFRVMDAFGRPRMSRLFRSYIKDKTAFQESLKPLLELPIKQILPSHGKVILADSKDALQAIHDQVSE